MKNHQSGFSSLVAIIILLIIIAGGAYWFTRKPAEVPTTPEKTTTTTPVSSAAPTTPPTPDETAGWKTYKNEKYGFEFKYPESWSGRDCHDQKLYSDEYATAVGLRNPSSFYCLTYATPSEIDGYPAWVKLYKHDSLFGKYPTLQKYKSYLIESGQKNSTPDFPFTPPGEGTTNAGVRYLSTKAADADAWGTYYFFSSDKVIVLTYRGSGLSPKEVNRGIDWFKDVDKMVSAFRFTK